MRERAPGGAALGVWGCKPPAEERPRRGPEALGDLDAPLWGAIDSLAHDQGEGWLHAQARAVVAARALAFALLGPGLLALDVGVGGP